MFARGANTQGNDRRQDNGKGNRNGNSNSNSRSLRDDKPKRQATAGAATAKKSL
jgi:hypothetical protein